ncbi:MAG TPA: HD domain-containing phosphohydrolase [Solirubrobacteraceae bacterium]|nr:HD domain-containing phosphohydrolase [Solirubrobacteraceae bacterium]
MGAAPPDVARLKVIKAGCLVTWSTAAAATAYLLLTLHLAHRGIMMAVLAAAIIDGGAMWWLREHIPRARRFNAILAGWNVSHVVAAAALCALDGGMTSPFAAIFFLSVAFAAVALPTRAVVAVAAADVGAVFAVSALARGPASPWAGDLMWAAALVVTAAVCGVIAEDRERRLLALRDAKAEMLHRLARVVEFRDDETACHVERMSAYTELIARRIGLGEFATELRLASTMHDIGKVAIPDAILLKPAALTDAERAVMERHAAIGHHMLSGQEGGMLELAATIALTHHERYDGTGYPNGLAGQEIPLAGRIVAIADVFDALTSDRVYKRAMPVADALEILRAGSGTQFDPRMVEAFIDVLDDVERIRTETAPAAAQPRAEERFGVERVPPLVAAA